MIFFYTLINNEEYKKIKKAYEQIVVNERNTQEHNETIIAKPNSNSEEIESKSIKFEYFEKIGNKDIDILFNPEYLKSKNIKFEDLFPVEDREIERLLQREINYQKQCEKNSNKTAMEKYKAGIAENSNHDYSWGIILKDPVFLMRNEEMDTPYFKGNITVEKIGDFASASLFRKRALEREKHKNIAIKKRNTVFGKKLTRDEKQKDVVIKEVFYRYKATKILSDNIYRVTKKDDKGNIRTDIVFSPIGPNDIVNPEQKEFIKEVYFSDYMLNLAKANGGYAGRIIRNSNGLTISNKYSIDEIKVAKLFKKKMKGCIYEKRGTSSKIINDKTEDDFLKMINRNEREREFNE